MEIPCTFAPFLKVQYWFLPSSINSFLFHCLPPLVPLPGVGEEWGQKLEFSFDCSTVTMTTTKSTSSTVAAATDNGEVLTSFLNARGVKKV